MKEKIKEVKPGFTLFIANMLMLAISLFLIIWGIIETANHPSVIPVASIISGSILLIIWFIFINGFLLCSQTKQQFLFCLVNTRER